MKTNYIFLIIIFLFSGLMSCNEDFLEQQPIGSYSNDILGNREGVNALLIGAYSYLNGEFGGPGGGLLATAPIEALFGSIHGGEVFKGSNAGDLPQALEASQFHFTTGNGDVLFYWRTWWDAVYRCNQVLQVLQIVTEMTADEKKQVEAEVKFLRGHYHFLLKRAFNNVPYIDESVEVDFRISNFDENGDYVQIWEQILSDFDFARKNLPAEQTELGRPNSWAAESYYGKVLLYMGNDGFETYNEALQVFSNVIDNGKTANGLKYDLVPRYHDNFKASTENNSESVFAVQHSSVDGTSATGFNAAPNGLNVSQLLGVNGTSTAPGWGRGWGFFQPTPWFADHFRVNADGLPLLDMYTNIGTRIIDDMGKLSSDPFTLDPSPVDPRIDWTITRRGIPCLDYGVAPGSAWIRQQDHGGPYISKKWFVNNSEQGTFETSSGFLRNAINVSIIRFADVLLMAAELEARVGDLNKARTYVNRVRERMVNNQDDPENWVKLSDGTTNAANYIIGLYPADGSATDAFTSREKALDAILFERTLELGTEGHRFYDVVRFGKGDLIFNAFIDAEEVRFDYLEGSEYTEVPDKYLPIPRTAIDNSRREGVPTLKQNPGY